MFASKESTILKRRKRRKEREKTANKAKMGKMGRMRRTGKAREREMVRISQRTVLPTICSRDTRFMVRFL